MCIFCKIINGEIPCYKVYENDYVLAFLDLGQVTKGHTLIVPKNHSSNILDINPTDAEKLMDGVLAVTKLLKEKLGCEGFNILNNCGEYAGQTVMHTHIHIIPRYKNDNFTIPFPENKVSKEEFESILSEIKKGD